MIGPETSLDFDEAAELEIEIKYDGYVRRQAETVERFAASKIRRSRNGWISRA